MDSVLKKYSGYSHFRPYQKEAIEKVLEGRDCLGVMATGSGKSLCYQIPPLISKKTAVVVSPLLSLMRDQVTLEDTVEYFGGSKKDSVVGLSDSLEGNCDNSTGTKLERDLSRESFLLLSCIKLCGGHFGLTIPIDVLRGSLAKKIKNKNFDKLPVHGLGKNNSSNWWMALGGLLLANGFLNERIQGSLRFISVSPKGVQFLCTDNTAQQKPLVLAMTSEMIIEEAVDFSQSEIGNHQSITSLDSYSFTEAETELYNMLLDTRMQIAKDNGTAPYAICGDQTIIEITKIRPSTRAGLANIDGVNHHFVVKHGTMILETISRLSQELNLQLDCVVPTVHIQSRSLKELQHSSLSKPGPARIMAWNMWHKYGHSFGEIANWSGRAAPIKEQAVIEYVLEAARYGYEVKWVRFCEEIGLSVDIASQIGAAISKVGARDRLKPIKEELPENVSYSMIMAFLVMEELGLSVKQTLTAKSSDGQPESTGNKEQHHRHVESPPKKIQKVHEHDLASTNVPEATEDAMMQLGRSHDGVTLEDTVEYFGGSKKDSVVGLSDSLEGNCDNSTGTKLERDLSRESFLLLSCIKLCGGHFGLTIPIDVLRGSLAKKIKNKNFDKLPVHGLGKNNSSNWWMALGGLLLANGFLNERIQGSLRFISVSPKGVQFLCTANTAQQKPLVLAMTSEVIIEEAVDFSQSEIGNHQSITSLDSYSFTEAETELYNMLLDTRIQIAKDNGTAPYAICGDQTIIEITMIRPSTRAGLANIDGVNHHFVAKHGTMILETISQLSQELNLQLDCVVPTVHIQSRSPKELQHFSLRKPGPARIVAWKMWQKYGLSFGEIANWSGRAAPIKEHAVILYVLEAARYGYEVKWVRFCEEIGLSVDIASQIGAAISKVGARDRLKPIKEELPENVSYEMIKAFLVMEELGLSVKQTLTAKSSDGQPESTGNMEQHHRHVESPPKKIQKVHEHDLASTNVPEATKDALMQWVRSHDGVTLEDTVEYFVGSKKDSVVGLLDSLEGEFLVSKKNGLYIAM